jgi:hypothetical protein
MTDMPKGGWNSRFYCPFIPSAALQQSFRPLKAAFTIAPVLVHFDLAKLIQLKTDFSGFATLRLCDSRHHLAAGKRGPGS